MKWFMLTGASVSTRPAPANGTSSFSVERKNKDIFQTCSDSDILHYIHFFIRSYLRMC